MVWNSEGKEHKYSLSTWLRSSVQCFVTADLKKIDKNLKFFQNWSHSLETTFFVLVLLYYPVYGMMHSCCLWNFISLTKLWTLFWELTHVLDYESFSEHTASRKETVLYHMTFPKITKKKDFFSGLWCLPGIYSIKVDENVQPVILHTRFQ